MKKTSVNDLLLAMEKFDTGSTENTIELDEDIMKRAKASLDRMLELS